MGDFISNLKHRFSRIMNKLKCIGIVSGIIIWCLPTVVHSNGDESNYSIEEVRANVDSFFKEVFGPNPPNIDTYYKFSGNTAEVPEVDLWYEKCPVEIKSDPGNGRDDPCTDWVDEQTIHKSSTNTSLYYLDYRKKLGKMPIKYEITKVVSAVEPQQTDIFYTFEVRILGAKAKKITLIHLPKSFTEMGFGLVDIKSID